MTFFFSPGWRKQGFSRISGSQNANISTLRCPIELKSFLCKAPMPLLHFQLLRGALPHFSWPGLVKVGIFVNFRPKNANISTMRGPIELKSFLRGVSRSLLHFQPLGGAPTRVSWSGLAENFFSWIFSLKMQISPRCELRLTRNLFCVTSRGPCFTFSYSAELLHAFPERGWRKI